MTVVAITSVSQRNARRYVDAMAAAGAEARVLLPESHGGLPAADLLRGAGGLLLSGGPDVHPARYGQEPDADAGLKLCPELDELEFGRWNTPCQWICRCWPYAAGCSC